MSLKKFKESFSAVVSCDPETPVKDIASKMKFENVGTVIVRSADKRRKAEGIISDRDLALRCLADSKDPAVLRAKDVMSSPLVAISSDAGILDLIEAMGTNKVRRMAIQENGDIVGVLSMGDVYELLSYEMSKLAASSGPRNERLIRRNRPSERMAA